MLNRLRAELGSIVGSRVGRAVGELEGVEPPAGVEKLTVGNASERVESAPIVDVGAVRRASVGISVEAAVGEETGSGEAVMADPQAAKRKHIPVKAKNRKRRFIQVTIWLHQQHKYPLCLQRRETSRPATRQGL